MTPTHSLIIPTYGKPELVKQCVESFWNNHIGQNSTEIIIVDDGSRDLTLQRWCDEAGVSGKIHLFTSNTDNKGFAHTVNTGLSEAKGEYLTLVNNDIIFTEPILDKIERAFSRTPDIGIVGARLLYPNKTIQHAGLTYRQSHKAFLHQFKHQNAYYPQANKSCHIIAVTGALFAISRKAYKILGPFDESYFLACEDVDYCLRAWNNGFHVFYDPSITAIHEEGGTRGSTPQAKTKINHSWKKKEEEGIERFKKNLKNYNMSKIQSAISKLNSIQSRKLEIGSGYNPQPGYKHLDVRRGLPELDYVVDFSKQKLPMVDSTMQEILANHVIEHISWRRLPFVIKEWYRVLMPGGKLVLRTPNLKFICESYLAKIITKEHPNDEGFIKQNLSKEITPSWWANIKLFSGQDYDANFHCCCFDFDMLSDLLTRYGFVRVSEVKFDREYSPGELQVEAVK